MRFNLVLASVYVIAILMAPALADEIDDHLLALKYGQFLYRIDAIQSLCCSKDPRVAGALIGALKDKEAGIRANAAMCLGCTGNSSAIAPLTEASKDDYENIRVYAAGSLVLLGETEYFDYVLQALQNENRSVRWAAVLSLGGIGINDTRAVGPLIEALNDTDFAIQRAVILYLGKINDTRAVGPLIEALKDKDLEIRSAAAESLGNIGDPKATEALTYIANKDPIDLVRTSAKTALEKIRGR